MKRIFVNDVFYLALIAGWRFEISTERYLKYSRLLFLESITSVSE
jgi:hypothetical protein